MELAFALTGSVIVGAHETSLLLVVANGEPEDILLLRGYGGGTADDARGR